MARKHRSVSMEFRQKIVDAKLRGESISSIAKRFEFPYSTVYGIWKRFKEKGEVKPGKRGGSLRKPRLDDVHVEHLVNVLEHRPAATLLELQRELNDNFNDCTDAPLMTITRSLEERAHMTLKRLHIDHERNNNAETIRKRAEYARNFRLDGRSYADCVFFDEAGFNLHATRSVGRAPVGERARQQDRPVSRETNVSLLIAVDHTGVRAHRCNLGPWNAELYIEFFHQVIFPLFDGRRTTFVMDNARFHHNPSFLKAVRDHGHRIEFIPPYLPWLNIAERVFGKIKPIIARSDLSSHNGLVNLIERMLATVTAKDCDGWIRETSRWLVVAEAGHPLGQDHDASAAIHRFGLDR